GRVIALGRLPGFADEVFVGLDPGLLLTQRDRGGGGDGGPKVARDHPYVVEVLVLPLEVVDLTDASRVRLWLLVPRRAVERGGDHGERDRRALVGELGL